MKGSRAVVVVVDSKSSRLARDPPIGRRAVHNTDGLRLVLRLHKRIKTNF